MNKIVRKFIPNNPIKKIQYYLRSEMELVDRVIKSRIVDRQEVIPLITEYIFSSGGKRIRPILTILCAKLFSYKGDRHINIAAAVEFIHTATLLHDDVVDESNLRRGKLSAHNKWGNKTSILVGDFLFSQAFCLISQDGSNKTLDIISKASAIIAEGEVMQLSALNNLNISYEAYLAIIKAKTAELFSAACQVSGAICNRSVEELIALHKFGLNLGIAFQIIDDLLDYVANEFHLGKSIGDDYREGKVTLPIILLNELANKKEKLFIERIFTDLERNDNDLINLIDLIKKYDIDLKINEIANNFLNEAKTALDIIPDSNDKSMLIEVIDYSLIRLN